MAVIDDNWNYRLDIGNINEKVSKEGLSLSDEVLQLNDLKVQKCDFKVISQMQDDELKLLIERNKQLRNEIEERLEKLNKQKTQYEIYKQDQKLLSQEVKDTHEAFLMAKKYYKKFLNMYYTIESRNNDKQIIFLQFFTETKKESENYYIRMQRVMETENYELLECCPKSKMFEEWKKSIQEPNKLHEVICNIRRAYLKTKNKKSRNI